MNPIRSGHGAGANSPHVEIALKDQRTANAGQTAANLTERKRRGKPFQKGNRVGGRKLALIGLGIEGDGIPEPARKDLRKANAYRQRRVREVASVHGYASAGTCSVLGSAAITLASHRQVAALAFQTGDPAMHELAARLAEKHSQLEIKASWMAKNEAGAGKSKQDPHSKASELFGQPVLTLPATTPVPVATTDSSSVLPDAPEGHPGVNNGGSQ